jgi:hypothetical protein
MKRVGVFLAFLTATLIALTFGGVASAQTIWLDQPLHVWNVAGAPIPTAPPAQLAQAMCRAQERSANAPEESPVAGAGWRLETYWPIQRSGSLAVVLATSDYDGMCRPLNFNAFVFSNGAFVGTLSPVNMISRTDGVLNRLPTVQSSTAIQALFTRYAPTDPLYCPSLPSSQVTYQLTNGVIAPVKIESVPVTATSPSGPLTPVATPSTAARPTPAPTTPATLPRSGEPIGLPLAIGIALGTLALGLAARGLRDRG